MLKPFYDAALEISYDDACISLVIPIVNLLNAKLQSTAQLADPGLSQTKAALRDAMNRRFGDMKIRDNLIAATLLDPRFKDMYFSSHETENAKRVILSFLESQRTAAASTTEISHDDNSQPQLLTSTAPSPGSSPGL